MKYLLLIIGSLFVNLSPAQQTLPYTTGGLVSMIRHGYLVDKFVQENITIDDNISVVNHKGSLLLLDKWAEATILFDDGKLYKLPYVNYVATDDFFVIYLKDLSPEEMKGLATPDFPIISLVTDHVIALTLKNDEDGEHKFVKVSDLRFQTKPKTRFFEYFSNQPKDAKVLKSTYKKLKENKMQAIGYTDSHEDYEFITYSSYYIINKDKQFVLTSLSKNAVLKVLNDPDHKKELKKYIKKQKLKMSKPEDVQKFLDYYFSTYVN